MTNALITGATGMIGAALTAHLAQKGEKVTAVIRPGSLRKKYVPVLPGVVIIECGLEEITKLPLLAPKKHDAFFHLGWADTDKQGRNDKAKQDRNIEYTALAAETAGKLGCSVFVGAGSQAEYGRYDMPIKEDFETKPVTAYGRAKVEACKKSMELCEKFKIKHVWARIFSVYGPNDSPDTMIMYCIRSMLKKQRVSLTACTQAWDFLYCADAAGALALVAEKGRDKGIYNIGSGTGRVLMEYVKIIAKETGSAPDLGFGDIKTPKGGLQNLAADITKLAEDTGFKPETGFEQGIKETKKWCEENDK